MAVAALALVKLAHWGAAYACCAVLIGNTVSEAVSCGIMALFARQEPSFRPCADDPPRGYTSRELWEIVLPVTGSRLVASALQAGESVLIPACLAAYLWHPRRSRGAVWFLKRHGTAAYFFSVLGTGGAFPAC